MSEPFWVPLGASPPTLDPGAEVAYGEITAPVAVTATTEAAAAVVATAPAFTADGTSQYVVEAQLLIQPPGTSGQAIVFVLYLDGVSIGLLGQATATGATAPILPVRLARRLTPAAGARVFSVRAYVSSGTGNVYGGAGGVGVNMPGFIRVTKVPAGVGAGGGFVSPPALVTSLPASPVDGQEIVLTDSLTAGTYHWHLRYVAARASNRWVFVGGSPLAVDVTTPEATASTTYANLGTIGPVLAIPVAGEYDVAHGWTETAGPADTAALMSYDVGATAAVDADAARTGAGFGNPPNGSQARSKRKTLPVGNLTAKYRVTGGTARTFAERFMRATPIAIGG